MRHPWFSETPIFWVSSGFGQSVSLLSRFPSTPFIIRVPFVPAIRFQYGNPKEKRANVYY